MTLRKGFLVYLVYGACSDLVRWTIVKLYKHFYHLKIDESFMSSCIINGNLYKNLDVTIRLCTTVLKGTNFISQRLMDG